MTRGERDEERIQRLTDKYREDLAAKHESDVADAVFEWIGDQDDEPTAEEQAAYREHLERLHSEWLDSKAREYREWLIWFDKHAV